MSKVNEKNSFTKSEAMRTIEDVKTLFRIISEQSVADGRLTEMINDKLSNLSDYITSQKEIEVIVHTENQQVRQALPDNELAIEVPAIEASTETHIESEQITDTITEDVPACNTESKTDEQTRAKRTIGRRIPTSVKAMLERINVYQNGTYNDILAMCRKVGINSMTELRNTMMHYCRRCKVPNSGHRLTLEEVKKLTKELSDGRWMNVNDKKMIYSLLVLSDIHQLIKQLDERRITSFLSLKQTLSKYKTEIGTDVFREFSKYEIDVLNNYFEKKTHSRHSSVNKVESSEEYKEVNVITPVKKSNKSNKRKELDKSKISQVIDLYTSPDDIEAISDITGVTTDDVEDILTSAGILHKIRNVRIYTWKNYYSYYIKFLASTFGYVDKMSIYSYVYEYMRTEMDIVWGKERDDYNVEKCMGYNTHASTFTIVDASPRLRSAFETGLNKFIQDSMESHLDIIKTMELLKFREQYNELLKLLFEASSTASGKKQYNCEYTLSNLIYYGGLEIPEHEEIKILDRSNSSTIMSIAFDNTCFNNAKIFLEKVIGGAGIHELFSESTDGCTGFSEERQKDKC